jgi:hypothetical protein
MILHFSKNTEARGLDTTRVLSDAPPHLPGGRWTSADLFFLRDSLRHGMSVVEVAGFLRRTEHEVRQKAKELKLNYLNAADDLFDLRLLPSHSCLKLRIRVRIAPG